MGGLTTAFLAVVILTRSVPDLIEQSVSHCGPYPKAGHEACLIIQPDSAGKGDGDCVPPGEAAGIARPVS